jgi:hypothetical protein
MQWFVLPGGRIKRFRERRTWFCRMCQHRSPKGDRRIQLRRLRRRHKMLLMVVDLDVLLLPDERFMESVNPRGKMGVKASRRT